MPSVKNPNKPSRNRLAARAAHARKQQRKQAAGGRHGRDRAAKADTTRGARPGLLPTSGPRAPLSAKKQKKVIQRMALALKRKMEASGGKLDEVVMEDVQPAEKAAQAEAAAATEDVEIR